MPSDAETRKVAESMLGLSAGEDIEPLIRSVLLEAVKSAQEDLKIIMSQVRAINRAKQHQREVQERMQRDAAGLTRCRLSGDEPKFEEGGLGEKGYHAVEFAVLDPTAPLGYTLVEVDVSPGAPVTLETVQAALDRVRNDLDSMSELGEMESLRLQMAMDRLSKLMSTLSNILKKFSDTAQVITQNIK